MIARVSPTPERMADLHARAFAGAGRAWSAAEFAALLGSPHVFAVGGKDAFALVRVVADEAELLTIVTDPGRRRQGLARAVLAEAIERVRLRGGARLFLEVAADNLPARALYDAMTFRETTRRKGYYRRPDGATADALILRLEPARPGPA